AADSQAVVPGADRCPVEPTGDPADGLAGARAREQPGGADLNADPALVLRAGPAQSTPLEPGLPLTPASRPLGRATGAGGAVGAGSARRLPLALCPPLLRGTGLAGQLCAGV